MLQWSVAVALAAEESAPDGPTFIHIFGGMKYLAVWLLFINILLTAAVILFAFRASLLKEKVEELEAELGRSVSDVLNNPLSDDRPIVPSSSRRKRGAGRS